MGETITIIEFFKIISKRWKLIIIFTLISTLLGGGFTKYVQKTIYQASSQILVNQYFQSEVSTESSQIRNNVDLINTYNALIKSPLVLEQVIHELQLDLSVEQLNRMVTINNHDYSYIFTIIVENTVPEDAIKITNKIIEVFQNEVRKIFNMDIVSILTKPDMDKNLTEKVPNLFFNMIISVIIGVFAGMALALLLEILDHTIKDSKDVEQYLKLPVLGAVQKISKKEARKSINYYISRGETVDNS